jgi:hypothetical protein
MVIWRKSEDWVSTRSERRAAWMVTFTGVSQAPVPVVAGGAVVVALRAGWVGRWR